MLSFVLPVSELPWIDVSPEAVFVKKYFKANILDAAAWNKRQTWGKKYTKKPKTEETWERNTWRVKYLKSSYIFWGLWKTT